MQPNNPTATNIFETPKLETVAERILQGSLEEISAIIKESVGIDIPRDAIKFERWYKQSGISRVLEFTVATDIIDPEGHVVMQAGVPYVAKLKPYSAFPLHIRLMNKEIQTHQYLTEMGLADGIRLPQLVLARINNDPSAPSGIIMSKIENAEASNFYLAQLTSFDEFKDASIQIANGLNELSQEAGIIYVDPNPNNFLFNKLTKLVSIIDLAGITWADWTQLGQNPEVMKLVSSLNAFINNGREDQAKKIWDLFGLQLQAYLEEIPGIHLSKAGSQPLADGEIVERLDKQGPKEYRGNALKRHAKMYERYSGVLTSYMIFNVLFSNPENTTPTDYLPIFNKEGKVNERLLADPGFLSSKFLFGQELNLLTEEQQVNFTQDIIGWLKLLQRALRLEDRYIAGNIDHKAPVRLRNIGNRSTLQFLLDRLFATINKYKQQPILNHVETVVTTPVEEPALVLQEP